MFCPQRTQNGDICFGMFTGDTVSQYILYENSMPRSSVTGLNSRKSYGTKVIDNLISYQNFRQTLCPKGSQNKYNCFGIFSGGKVSECLLTEMQSSVTRILGKIQRNVKEQKL